VSSGEELLTLTGHSSPIYGIALSPDGNLLISTSSDGIRVWDATPVEPDHRAPDHDSAPVSHSVDDR
jgi:WD40 repeat protein